MKYYLVLGLVASLLLATCLFFQSTPAPATSPPTSASTCHLHGSLPDPICTPGVDNPNVTQANIHQTICVSGWSATIRPPVSYTSKLKAQQMKAYGFTDSITAHEEDHLVSLQLGGHPTDPKNLWPEPDASPNPKDAIENKLHAKVCSGTMSLDTARQRIATNWQTALN